LFNTYFPVDDLYTTGLVPRYDFSVYALDAQRFPAFSTEDDIIPGSITGSAPAIHDPWSVVDSGTSWAVPAVGRLALIAGFPIGNGNVDGRLAGASVGTILSDAQARDALEILASVGDAEGAIPYDADAEFLLEGPAVSGMSGSGVFDEHGVQIGIIVRASFDDSVPQIVRAVRMSFVVESLQRALLEQPTAARDERIQFLPPF
jgi:hypothetical protein